MPVVLRQLGWLPAEFLSIAIVLVAVAAVIVIWLLVARPLRDLTQALRRLTEGQRDARVDPAAMDDDLRVLGVAFNELALAIGDSERGLRDLHVELEARVAARTAELADLNRELQQFTSSASHDLAAPLRAIAGFATALEEDHGAALGDDGRATLTRIRAAAGRADELLHGLLALAKVGRHELDRVEVDVTTLAREVVAELRERDPGRAVDVVVADGLRAEADRVLLRAALINLLGNAWKFTGRVAAPRVELAAATLDDRPAFVVRDNGAGFDMAHAAKLAQPFARLHSVSEFPGSGIGLATVRRIVERHGGRLHGEGVVGAGATFTFSL
jgi:light-regulated signal transduction histidine kinase (bacteriophytochrome)/HAMP domain-containing protein